MNTKTKLALALALIGVGIAGRLLPHEWNFTPIIAIALFSGAYLGKRYAAVPLIAMFLSDAFIGFYNPLIMLSVYGSMLAGALIGRKLHGNVKIFPLAFASTSSSILFFIVTNAAVWAFSGMYPLTASGLMTSYAAGIPFFRNMVIGDLWYTFMIFGAFEAALYLKNKTGPREVRVS